MRTKSFRKSFGAELGGSPRHSRRWGPHAGGGQGCIPQLGSLQHCRAPVHDSASGLAKLTDVLNFLKQMQRNLPSVQTPGSQKYLMGCERGQTDFIPGSLTVDGSRNLLLRSRKSACSFLDIYLVSKNTKSHLLFFIEAVYCFSCMLYLAARRGQAVLSSAW